MEWTERLSPRVLGYDFPPGTLALAMGILFTVGMSTSILRGTCKNPEPDALKEAEERGPEDGNASDGSYGTDGNAVPLMSAQQQKSK